MWNDRFWREAVIRRSGEGLKSAPKADIASPW